MLEQFSYCPILYTRNAELKAFSLLPHESKVKIFPLFAMRPVPNARELKRTFDRILEAIGEGVFGLTLDDNWRAPQRNLPSHFQFQSLFQSENGYEQYYGLVSELGQAVPCLQGQLDEESIELQIRNAAALNKDFILRLNWEQHQYSGHRILSFLLAKQIHFVLFIDLGWSVNLFNRQVWANSLLSLVASEGKFEQNEEGVAPVVETVLCGSSFPNEFASVAMATTPIQERQVFRMLENNYNLLNLKYGDWGSARQPNDDNQIMRPSPRIDLPTLNDWLSYKRVNDGSYQDIAQRIVSSPTWDENIEIWGTNSILWTSQGEEGAIMSQQIAASVRMNIHMHIQANFEGELSLRDSSEVVDDI